MHEHDRLTHELHRPGECRREYRPVHQRGCVPLLPGEGDDQEGGGDVRVDAASTDKERERKRGLWRLQNFHAYCSHHCAMLFAVISLESVAAIGPLQ